MEELLRNEASAASEARASVELVASISLQTSRRPLAAGNRVGQKPQGGGKPSLSPCPAPCACLCRSSMPAAGAIATRALCIMLLRAWLQWALVAGISIPMCPCAHVHHCGPWLVECGCDCVFSHYLCDTSYPVPLTRLPKTPRGLVCACLTLAVFQLGQGMQRGWLQLCQRRWRDPTRPF